MLDEVATRFRSVAPAADGWTIRVVRERSQGVMVRQDVLEPLRTVEDRGAMVTVQLREGSGYAATSDLSAGGLRAAGAHALRWARAAAGRSVAAGLAPGTAHGTYRSPVAEPWSGRGLGEIVALLQDACARLARGPAIVDRIAALDQRESETLIHTSAGGSIHQRFAFLQPYLSATANRAGESQTRSFGREGARQGGFEQLVAQGFASAPERIGDEALELLAAPDCPSASMALVLMPTQMVLQIHESIGHPLELDRILGDERNYAGTSFVTPAMFGTYRYGSELLNVTFDPGPGAELASYAFDDEGTPASREHLIRDGLLIRGLGGALSQRRSGLPGTANARASSWNRPPIDRMANLNLEPGGLTLEQLVGGVERGILMDTNRSWSIDDSRNKFQFGCEHARLIRDGRLAGVVKNANYRGISATFWRSLDGVGREVLVAGTANCGKGEPNQMIHVGHATPACRFRDVDVFGGRLMAPAREHFFALADAVQEMLEDGERALSTCSGEDSDFVRLNHGRIRQAGHVAHRRMAVDLIAGDRHAAGECVLSGEFAPDRAALAALIAELRAQRRLLAGDPHLLYSEDPAGSTREDRDQLPASDEALAAITELAAGMDVVGIWASGGIHAGFASSFGQRSWHSVHTFNFDWSCHLRADAAVRCGYAGTSWDRAELERRFLEATSQLAALERAPAKIAPGRYRAYFAPAALRDLLGMLSWGGFSCKAGRTKTTPLLKLATGEASMHHDLTLVDDRAGGLSPAFTNDGFRKAGLVTLIAGGRQQELLISPRSAREFALQPNSGEEYPDSLAMAGGTLERVRILAELGTGLYINNVWYCNYSDPNACRITGMTRFACFWVEQGEIVAPLPVMRFDDSMYHLLGDRLLGITRERDLLLSSSTYGGRSLGSMLVPGILVEGLTLTL